MCMTTAKLFENGRSQAVRLPKEYRFNGDGLSLFTDDFMCNGREEIDHQERETL